MSQISNLLAIHSNWIECGLASYVLVYNGMRHHSGQNVVASMGAPEWVDNKFWPQWSRIPLYIRIHTQLIGCTLACTCTRQILVLFSSRVTTRIIIFVLSEKKETYCTITRVPITIFTNLAILAVSYEKCHAVTTLPFNTTLSHIQFFNVNLKKKLLFRET